MKILSKDANPMFMAIWVVRVFLLLSFVLLIGYSLVVINQKIDNSIKEYSFILITGLLITSFFLKFLQIKIVHYSSEQIILSGAFGNITYPKQEFNKIGTYLPFLELYFIEFSNNKRYHIMVRDLRANDIGNLFSDPKDTISDLTVKLEKNI
jgi:hypothetical protein